MEDEDKTTLNTTKSDRPVWLMKCPPAVTKSIQSAYAAADSTPVSKVCMSIDPLRPEDRSSRKFTMEMVGGGSGSDSLHIPKSYSMNMYTDFVPLCVFSDTNQGKVAAEGKIDHKFDMKPHHENIDDYRKMCRERTNKSMVKNRQIQIIDNDRGALMRPMPGMMGFITSTSKDKKKPVPVKGSDMKRTRRDRGELEDIMFKLFERQPNWALKQLVQETDQPAQFLKEILNELCVYNKRGTNQGTYELKPEYKKSVEDTGPE